MESTTFYRGISNIDAHLFFKLLATVEHENESSETAHYKYCIHEVMNIIIVITKSFACNLMLEGWIFM